MQFDMNNTDHMHWLNVLAHRAKNIFDRSSMSYFSDLIHDVGRLHYAVTKNGKDSVTKADWLVTDCGTHMVLPGDSMKVGDIANAIGEYRHFCIEVEWTPYDNKFLHVTDTESVPAMCE